MKSWRLVPCSHPLFSPSLLTSTFTEDSGIWLLADHLSLPPRACHPSHDLKICGENLSKPSPLISSKSVTFFSVSLLLTTCVQAGDLDLFPLRHHPLHQAQGPSSLLLHFPSHTTCWPSSSHLSPPTVTPSVFQYPGPSSLLPPFHSPGRTSLGMNLGSAFSASPRGALLEKIML